MSQWPALQHGFPLSHIHNSRLCHASLMEDLVMLLDHVTIQNLLAENQHQHAELLGATVHSLLSELSSHHRKHQQDIYLGPNSKYNFHSPTKSPGNKKQDSNKLETVSNRADVHQSESFKIKLNFYTDADNMCDNYTAFVSSVQQSGCVDVCRVSTGHREVLAACHVDHVVLCDVTGFTCGRDVTSQSAWTEISVNQLFLRKVLPVLQVRG